MTTSSMCDVTQVNIDWNLLAAAVSSRDNDTKQAFIDAVYKFANLDPGDTHFGQFPLMYQAQSGAAVTGRSSPRQGAVYAPLLVK